MPVLHRGFPAFGALWWQRRSCKAIWAKFDRGVTELWRSTSIRVSRFSAVLVVSVVLRCHPGTKPILQETLQGLYSYSSECRKIVLRNYFWNVYLYLSPFLYMGIVAVFKNARCQYIKIVSGNFFRCELMWHMHSHVGEKLLASY